MRPILGPQQPMANPLLLPPLTLAYIGDAVYEVFVRTRLLEADHIKVNDLHRVAVRYVRARAQAAALSEMHSQLSDDEQDVVRRGRNAKGRAAPKSSDAAEYAASTGFEALVGYLYLSAREERLRAVLTTALHFLSHQ